MTARAPTILATSGGFRPGRRTDVEYGPLVQYAVELAGVTGRAPRLCFLGTAGGDQQSWQARVYEAGRVAHFDVSCLTLFPMPNVADPRAHLLGQDVVWVGGGSVANLLALWRVHGLDEVFREVWESGVVLGGVSAGSLCWHVGGTTDSFGPELRAVTDGLALLPWGNGVHYDSEPERRPLLQRLVATGVLPTSYATDDGVGLVYAGTEFIEAVTEVPDRSAYRVQRTAVGGSSETPLRTRLLPQS